MPRLKLTVLQIGVGLIFANFLNGALRYPGAAP